MSRRVAYAALALGALACAGSVLAQTYPTRPIRAIVPFSPGGPTDIMARALGVKLTASLGQQVIVDNRAGGGGVIAAMIAKGAPPDGHTIFFGTISTLATNVATRSKLPYDPLRDFAPITLTAANPYFMVVHPAVPAKTVAEFVALARSKPGQLNFASSGAGGGAHLALEMFRGMAKLDMVHIPYKGSGAYIQELMAGQVQMTFAQPSITLPNARSGRLRIVGVTGRKSLASWPDARPIAETLPGYEATSWQGVVLPAGTPKAIVSRLHGEIVRALNSEDLSKRLVAEGSEIGGITPEEFAQHIRSEIDKWKRVVAEANIRID